MVREYFTSIEEPVYLRKFFRIFSRFEDYKTILIYDGFHPSGLSEIDKAMLAPHLITIDEETKELIIHLTITNISYKEYFKKKTIPR